LHEVLALVGGGVEIERPLVVDAEPARHEGIQVSVAVELIQGQVDLGGRVDIDHFDREDRPVGRLDAIPDFSERRLLAGQLPEVDLAEVGRRREDRGRPIDVVQPLVIELGHPGRVAGGRVDPVDVLSPREPVQEWGGPKGQPVQVVLAGVAHHVERILLRRNAQQVARHRRQVQVAVAVEGQIARRRIVAPRARH